MGLSVCQKAPKAEYARHNQQKNLLYQIIQCHWQSFATLCESQAHPVPNFIKKEFEAYLRCGVLEYGFARVYCQECRYDRLIGFSCKKRGFCGSCLARRMSESSARLVDSLIPRIPTRQWVLSVPAPLRYLIAYDNDALNAVLSIFMSVLFSYLRKKSKRCGGKALRAQDYYPGAVTFIQRFGSALNLNVHLHSQVSDGVYVRYANNKIHFIRVLPPSSEEIKTITIKIAKKVHRYLERRMQAIESDNLLEREPLLAKCYMASIRYLSALGEQSGKPLLRLIAPEQIKEETPDRTVMGFNLHASVAIEATDRAGLERTLRYMGRPPLSSERLKIAPDGQNLLLTLKSPWRNGTTTILLTPFELIERLVALIPYPRKNLIRYHGFFAPNAELREEIISGFVSHQGHDSKKPGRPNFAQLMARVFDIDVLFCPRCHSKMQLISLVTEPQAIKDILRSLKMSTAPPDIEEPSMYSIVYENDGINLVDDISQIEFVD
ncbi:MAG: transposase [Myxococcales bacterium]|nr:transposase [Myxococcales bacterium]